jgi:hypothetical protein
MHETQWVWQGQTFAARTLGKDAPAIEFTTKIARNGLIKHDNR